MKLELIKFVEEAMEFISTDSYELDSAKNDIEMLLQYLLKDEDYFLNVISRVKSPGSVKEKILKYDLYKKYTSPKELISGISDLIGVRIECRFIPDEEKVYMKLLDLFDTPLGDGFYCNSTNEKVCVKLDEPQPQYQKNGFEIYKIDGRYQIEDRTFNFELQIKSLVNNFWGDIEHRILYKNYSYLLTERFIKDMMGSIKENLTLIDKQLRVVYDHVFNLENNNLDNIEQIKVVLNKMTYDLYFHKIRTQLGFVVDFRSIVDLIVDFVFMRETTEGQRKIGEDLLGILKRLSSTLDRDQSFDGVLNLEKQPNFYTDFEKKVGDSIVNIINKDFRWNICLRIIFDIEKCENHVVLEKFAEYIVRRFYKIVDRVLDKSRFLEGDTKEVRDFLTEAIIDSFIKDMNVEALDDNSMALLEENLQGYLLGIVSTDQWEKNKDIIKKGILDFKAH